MPSLKLTAAEARAVAVYLQAEHGRRGGGAAPEAEWEVDREKARRGRERFSQLGCAGCHELGPGLAPVRSMLTAKPLAALDGDAGGGCLSVEPSPAAPRYLLSEAQRRSLRETLREPRNWRQSPTPAERVPTVLAGLNCYACHSRFGVGGPGASRSDYFTTLSDFDLGDEGRLPPHLSHVGHKLRPAWLGEVLTNAGVVRPYMAVRMPQFGSANVGPLTAAFIAADALASAGQSAPAGEEGAGRGLVGLGGYACVNCHRFGPYPSLGISIMDMTQMAKRLNWDWFRRYLEDPPALRPGTRMPSFWPEGQAAVTNVLAGDMARQIAAIWAYLELGTNAPPPLDLIENLEPATGGRRANYE